MWNLVMILMQDNARLTAENANLTEKLASSERANGRLIQELDGVSLVSRVNNVWGRTVYFGLGFS